jgi:soluble P-type ATPase
MKAGESSREKGKFGGDVLIEVDIPGWKTLRLEHLVLDFNGTLACDGGLLEGVREGLYALSPRLEIHVVTADTFGRAKDELHGLPCSLTILPTGDQSRAKLLYIEKLSPQSVAAIGNGRNDRLMLEGAALGIAILEAEGAGAETLQSADVVCRNIRDALALLDHPKRLVATLRA